MLRDPKSFALVENFGGQWLQFKNIDVVRPDLERFPMFDEGLRQAMRRETELFLERPATHCSSRMPAAKP